jgi:hypothetical protein
VDHFANAWTALRLAVAGLGDADFAQPSGCTGWLATRPGVPSDLIAHLPDAAAPPAVGLVRSREMLERIAGSAFPASMSDPGALLIGTGRCDPTDEQTAELGPLAARLPLVLG